MPNVSLSPIGNGYQFTGLTGQTLAGGFLYTYLAGTSTPAATYTDSAGTIANSNPIILDAAGHASLEIWLIDGQLYKFVSTDSLGVPQYQWDNISGQIDAASGLYVTYTALAASSGSSLVGFLQSGAGAVAETAQNALQNQIVWDYQFGAVGNGVTDDTTALTNFWNSAIANPSIPHRLRNLRYATSAQLPTINVNDVDIQGVGCEFHLGATLMIGTVIKWIGSAGGTMAVISSQNNAAIAKVGHVKFKGIGFDCNSGLAANGLVINSIVESDIDVTIANASNNGLTLGVVAASLDERNLGRNKIRLLGRQLDGTGISGISLVMNGDSGANVSMNDFWIDIQHGNAQAIVIYNSDNNVWNYVRTYGAGAATESIACLGGAASATSCRDEIFRFLSSNLPLHTYGTGTYTVGAQNIRLDYLDTGNGTPAPIVDTGSTCFWNLAQTPFGDTPWVAYTPVITSSAGALTTVAAAGRYLQRGRIVHVMIQIAITTNGTGSGNLLATLPISAAAFYGGVFIGKERASTNKAIVGYVGSSGSSLVMDLYDGTYPGANGYAIDIAGSYEIA